MDNQGSDDECSPLTAHEPYRDDPAQAEATTTGDSQEPAGQPAHRLPSEGLPTQQNGLSKLEHPQQGLPGFVVQAPVPGNQPGHGAKQVTSGVTPRQPGVVQQQPPTSHPAEQGLRVHGALDRPPVFQSAPLGPQMTAGNTLTPGAQAVRPGQVPEGVPQNPSSQQRPGQSATPNSQQPPYQHMQQQHYAPQQQLQQAQLYQQPQQIHEPAAQPAADQAFPHQQQPGQSHQHAYQQQQYQQQYGEQHGEQQRYPQQQQQQQQSYQRELHFPADTPQRMVRVSQPKYEPLVSNCPQCHSGVMSPRFSSLGILLAIFCFPLGILFCFLMREKRCSNCGLTI